MLKKYANFFSKGFTQGSFVEKVILEPKVNTDAYSFLSYYIALEIPPNYALYLKGEWGCGKTKFLTDLIDNDGNADREYVVISLFGVSDVEHIDTQLLSHLKPILTSKYTKIFSELATQLAKAFTPLSLSAFKSLFLNLDYDKLKNFIIVFDDIERSRMSVPEMLGYINLLVERHGLKVILIGDESKLMENHGSEWLGFKEKVIGTEFLISPDIENAIGVFVEGWSNELLDTIKFETITDRVNDSETRNLRVLGQCLRAFERLYESLDSEIREKKDLILQLFMQYFALFSEWRLGQLMRSSIISLQNDAVSATFARFSDTARNLALPEGEKITETTGYQHLSSKYPDLNFTYMPLLSSELWGGVVCDGVVGAAVNDFLKQSFYFQNENTPVWKKLYYYPHLSDDEFQHLYPQLISQLRNSDISSMGMLKSIAGLTLSLSNQGIVSDNCESILSLLKSATDVLAENDLLPSKTELSHFGFQDGDRSYENLGYQGEELESYDKFLTYLDQKRIELDKRYYVTCVDELMSFLPDEIDKFMSKLVIGNQSHQETTYKDMPILNRIDLDDFVGKLIKVPADKWTYLDMMFKKRFEHDYLIKKLIEEKPWLECLGQKLRIHSEKLDDKKKPLSKYRISALVDTIESIVEDISRY